MKTFSFFAFITLLLFSGQIKAQVAINSNGAVPNSSAMLDISSSNKGILIPRIVDTTSVQSPAVGLLIYRTNTPQGFFYYDGLKWQKMGVTGTSGATSPIYVDLTTNQTVNGQKIWNSNATFNSGFNSSGGTVNLNHNSNFVTNINTGTSSGIVNIANGTVGGNNINVGNLIGSTGINLRVGTGNFSLDGVAGATYSFGASTTTGIITIGGTAQTGNITLGSSTAAQSILIGNGVNTGAQTVGIANGATGANSTVNILSGVGTAGLGTLNIGNNTRVATINLGNISPAAARTTTIAGGNSAVVDMVNIGIGVASVAGGKTINIGTGATSAAGGNTINIGTTAPTGTGTNKITIGSTGTTNGMGLRLGNSRLTINKPLAPTTGLNANTTLTVAQILNASIIGFASNLARTLTFPTARGAAGLVQALPGTPAVGDVFTFEVFNTGTGAITLVAGTGITIVNTNTITNASSRVVTCRVTNVTSGSEAISVY